MKKIAIFFTIIIIIVSTFTYIFLNQQAKYREVKKENAKFDIEEGQEFTGQDLATIINKVMDTNRQNEILKDEKGNYIDNDKNSIKMDITFTDVEVTHNIELIDKAGIANFVQNYRQIIFKCNKIQYHKSTGKIKYIRI